MVVKRARLFNLSWLAVMVLLLTGCFDGLLATDVAPVGDTNSADSSQSSADAIDERFSEEDLDVLWEAWQLVEDSFDGDIPPDGEIKDAIVAAAIESLGDRHTVYYSPEVAEFVRERYDGNYEGIGAFVDTNEVGQIFIVRPIIGSPAEAAGIEPGDVIIGVDGDSIIGKTQQEVVAVVRGPANSEVILTVLRDGVEEPFDVTITRARIEQEVVTSSLIEGNIGYVTLSTFNVISAEKVEEAIQEQIDLGATSLIFDLRDNGGGLLTAAVDIADMFLDEGVFLIIRDNQASEEIFRSESGDFAETIPLVVLVNESSASASEAIAAAVQDRDRATLVGTLTFGKGSVQSQITLSDGSQLTLTRARYYSPNDRTPDGVGVTPDIVVEQNEDPLTDGDAQLQRAIDYIRTGN